MDNDEKNPTPSADRDRDGLNTERGAARDADTPTERLDEAPSGDAAAAASTGPHGTPVATETTGTEPGTRSRRTRNILIGAGAGLALLAFGGGAFAIGAAVADDDDDRPGIHAPAGPGDDARNGQPGPRGQGDDRRGDDRDDHGTGDGARSVAPVDAADLREAADAAIAHASAEGVTSIEVERNGFDVEVRLADGTHTELLVDSEGTVRERRGDDAAADDSDDPLIDLDRLDDILKAAQSAATDAGATDMLLHSLSTSSSDVLYEVDLRSASRSDAEVELDSDLGVVRVDLDD